MNNVTLIGIIDKVSPVSIRGTTEIREFTLKIESTYKDKLFQDFIPIVLFGNKANEFVGVPGDKILVFGKAQAKQFVGKDGETRSFLSIAAMDTQFIYSKEQTIPESFRQVDEVLF